MAVTHSVTRSSGVVKVQSMWRAKKKMRPGPVPAAAVVPASTPLWAKLAVLSAGGVIEVAWYAAVSFALSSGPMRAG